MANWKKYIFDNDDYAAAQIMLAANYGGRAINITATTAAHAMSYKITSLYGLPHGHAVAVCLPEIWEYMMKHMDKCLDKRGKDYLNGIFDNISNAMGVDTPLAAVGLFRGMMKEMDLRNPMSDPINRTSDLKFLSSSVNPVRLKNNPVEMDDLTILSLYDAVVK